ncbi:MAG TPA: hypothetical protein VEB21_11490 [Terriglobales bacterium]|nr:hypothetical protein [Terriglobales bacterium]
MSTGGDEFATAVLPRISGTISDDGALAEVTLEVGSRSYDLTDYLLPDRDQSGLFHFAVSDIPLSPGANAIAVNAVDSACQPHTGRASVDIARVDAPGTTNLYALAIEVTQAIQGRDHEDGVQQRTVPRSASALPPTTYDGGPLVAHKRTVVRAYAVAENGSDLLRGVPARLTVRRGNQTLELISREVELLAADNVRDGANLDAAATLFNQRRRVAGSWNFVLPYSLIAPGAIAELTLQVNPPDLDAVAECTGCNDAANVLRVDNVPFAATNPLRARVLPYDGDSLGAPSDDLAERLLCGEVSRLYPIADGCGEGLGIEILPPRPQNLAELDLAGAAADTIAVQNNVCALMAADRDAVPSLALGTSVYLGLLPAGSIAEPIAFGSSADGHPHRLACVAAVEPDDPGEDAHDALAALVAQETAHGFLHADIAGIGHTAWHGCGGMAAHQLPGFPTYTTPSGAALTSASIGQFGFDPWSRTVLAPETTIDFMGFGYCSGDPWISPFTWQQLANVFARPAAFADSGISLLGGSGQSRSFAVTGYITSAGELELSPLFAMPRPVSLAQPPSGPYFFILRNAADNPVFAVPFGLNRHPEIPGGGTFAFAAPDVTGTARIDIQRDTQVLASFPVSANAPLVTLLHPSGGEEWAAGEVQVIDWTASDADGDSLRYLVQLSTDGGERWQTLSTGLTDTELAVDTSTLGGSSSARVRVFATDGVNTGSDESGSFEIGFTTPRLTLALPDSPAIVDQGAVLSVLAGYIDSDESNGPPGLRWEDEEGDFVAPGPRLDLAGSELTAGRHTLTITALGAGAATQTSEILTLLRAPRLEELPELGAACVGDCDGGGSVTVDEIITGVNIALGTNPITSCPAFDGSGDQQVTVDEILQAVSNALVGCRA